MNRPSPPSVVLHYPPPSDTTFPLTRYAENKRTQDGKELGIDHTQRYEEAR